MVVSVSDIINSLNDIAPVAIAEPWDNVGLIVGDRNRAVRSLLIALDPTNHLLDEAIACGADTIITHHPFILKPLPAIDTANPTGRFLEKALGARINILACHTNLDSAEHGVNDVLADLLGLDDLEPLAPTDSRHPGGTGLGRLGKYQQALSGHQFMGRLLSVLQLDSCLVAGPLPPIVRKVALCGGSGSDFAELAYRRGADLYLTAEVKHHVARWAEDCGFCVLDGTHYATERPIVHRLAERLRTDAEMRGWDLKIDETRTEQPPFYRVTAGTDNNPQATGETS